MCLKYCRSNLWYSVNYFYWVSSSPLSLKQDKYPTAKEFYIVYPFAAYQIV